MTFARAAAGLALLHILLGLLVFEPVLNRGGDNALYLILGDALRSGDGYRDLHLPGTPLHTKYPPLLPLLLAGVGWAGVGAAKIAMLLLSGTLVWTAALMARTVAGDRTALLLAGALAANPTLLEYGHYILSEVPFTLLVVAALWLANRETPRSAGLAMFAAAGAFATRSAGLAILLALPAAWLLQRRFRRAAVSGAVAAATLGGWTIYQRSAGSGGTSYLEQLLSVDPYAASAGTVNLAGLAGRAAENFWAYASRVMPHTVFGIEGEAAGGVAVVAGLAFAAAAVVGWTIRTRARAGAPEVFAVLYASLIAVWPPVWTDRRFLLPMLPVLLLFALTAAGKLPSSYGRWLKPGVAASIALFGVAWVMSTAPGRLDCVGAYRDGRPCEAANFASFYSAARWARDNTSPDAIIANRKPGFFYWYGRRRGDVYPYSSDPVAVMRGLEGMGADYVVVDRVSLTTDRYLIPAMRAHPNRFRLVYEGGNPPSGIFRLLPSPASAPAGDS